MHIPDNYLSPQTCAVMAAAMIPVWAVSIKKIKLSINKELNSLSNLYQRELTTVTK